MTAQTLELENFIIEHTLIHSYDLNVREKNIIYNLPYPNKMFSNFFLLSNLDE